MNPELNPSLDEFSTRYTAGKPQIVYMRLVNDIETPVSAFLKMAQDKPYAFLFESVQGGEQRGRYSVLGYDPDLIWRVRGTVCEISENGGPFVTVSDDPIASLKALHEDNALDIPDDLPPMAAGLFGTLGYDMVRHVEHLPDINPDPIGTPDALMLRPSVIAIFDQIAQEILLTTTIRPDAECTARQAYEQANQRLEAALTALENGSSPLRHTDVTAEALKVTGGIGQSRFGEKVRAARDYIRAGDIFQVVLGQRFSREFHNHPFALYRALRRLNPSPFLYYLRLGDHAVVGSSPEILVRLRGQTVTIRPIAGTRPRGKTPEEDAALAESLLADEKEMAEHLMLLDLGRNDVGRVAKAGTVRVTERAVIERYSHVMHIVSNVDGEVQDGLDAIDCLFAGFPAGTVSGAPKVRAMQIIDELEEEKRGIYGGAVGYLSAGGDMDTAIVLRTAIIKDGLMHVRAGAGIVLDSQPDYEYAECTNKAKALFSAATHAPYFDRN